MNGNLFEGLHAFSQVREKMDYCRKKNIKESSQICGAIDTGRVHLMSAVSDGYKYKIITTFNEQKAREIYEDIKNFEENVYYYPPKDFIFYNADMESGIIVKERLKALNAIRSGKDAVIVATVDSLMDKLIDTKYILDSSINIEVGSVVSPDAISHMLVKYGYERTEQVNVPGEFAIRGSIIDIYTMTEPLPFRIDLWDEEVDSIRLFEAENQRAVSNVEEVTITPATEYILSKDEIKSGIDKIRAELDSYTAGLRDQMKNAEAASITRQVEEFIARLEYERVGVPIESYVNYFYDKTVSLLDYLDNDETVLIFDESMRVYDRMNAAEYEYKESMVNRLQKGLCLPKQTEAIFECKDIYAKCQDFMTLHFTTLDQKIKGFKVDNIYNASMMSVNPYNSSWEVLIKDLNRYRKSKYRIIIMSASKTRAERLAATLMNDYEMSAFFSENILAKESDKDIVAGSICVTCGNIHKGYEYVDAKFTIITETDIFGTVKKKKKNKNKYTGQKIGDFANLKVGDYVVHENHGLGIYRGIEKMEVDKVVKDYIKIEYAKGGKLYVPATGLNRLQKYSGSESDGTRGPKINTLGTKEWNNTKQRVRHAVKDIAADLVKIYSARQNKKGFVYGEDTVWQKEFEEMFPYEETQDQLAAIEDTKRDMQSSAIMDRLICGDVGYGKTEIAIRAAFKAVQEGKQVVYLVPTTILAQQHYNTFVQRMKDFPVQIEMMSRFRTKKQMEQTIEGLKKGFVDIVVGTHRVLSADVQFKDLGLLIIDEEQRFGVAHKEKIKQLKNDVDVLTLTATPIPRTLHMSLVGIRDMSVLEEAPVDRLPIQTYVMEYNEEMVREAINRELARNGQVYYVYNKVSNIEEITARIAALVPDAQVTYAHGQMSERKLEQIMIDFINGDIDVLVSTTIIETGLDISNVNTMIIHDSDKLGLSQLYQLRGRIGRSNRTSYAFMMYKRDKVLKEIAEKRLQAIKEFTELGSGFKIAMRDLELRGAGNVLGAEQHGHMEAVGYDLYCKLLNQAVDVMKGVKEEEDYETTIDLDVDGYIPSTYIPNEVVKLNIYRKIAAIENEQEYDDMLDELIDRFGEPPKVVINLLGVALIKAKAHSLYISDITGDNNEIKMVMYEKAAIEVGKIPELLALYRNRLKFTGDKPPYFTLKRSVKSGKFADISKEINDFFADMQILIKQGME